jgi:hypothetical protein
VFPVLSTDHSVRMQLEREEGGTAIFRNVRNRPLRDTMPQPRIFNSVSSLMLLTNNVEQVTPVLGNSFFFTLKWSEFKLIT